MKNFRRHSLENDAIEGSSRRKKEEGLEREDNHQKKLEGHYCSNIERLVQILNNTLCNI